MDLPRLIYIKQECGNLEVAADGGELRNNNWTDRGSQKFYKVSSQQLRNTLTKAFWKTPFSWRFYGHGLRYVLIISSRL